MFMLRKRAEIFGDNFNPAARGAALVLSAILILLTHPAGAVELVSVNINGTSGNRPSSGVSTNADGEFVAFFSDATDLVQGDTNQVRDVFVRNRADATTERVSVNSANEQANRASQAQGGAPSIDGDGQIVAFYSDATNLVADDTNGVADVFVRLRPDLVTERVSVATDGSQANGPSLLPSISRDGRLVAFQSEATNLVSGDTNGQADIFVRDRTSDMTERLCGSVQGNRASITPAISADGNVVAFASASTNLVAQDTNNRIDIFTCDRRSGTLELISVSTAGVQGNGDSILPAISEDGRFVAFKSTANNLVPNDNNGVVDVFVRDRQAGTTQRVSVNVKGGDANDGSFPPSISYDGRFVAFGSAANNLVSNDFNQVSNVFVRDLQNGLTLLVDVNDQGQEADAGTPDIPPGISGDGKQIGFVSLAANLVPNDRNEQLDVFITRNPFSCDDQHPCPSGQECLNNFCSVVGGTPTPTPTSTFGANDCCQCGTACQLPSMGGCPTPCEPVRDAECLAAGNCVTHTPTPSPTPTLGPNDCCECTGTTCAPPALGECPAQCQPIRGAACLAAGHCATFTPTPSPTPTLGPTDCCQCQGSVCALPAMGECPAQCEPIRGAACLTTGSCATFTPTPTQVATPTPTPTLGADNCCQCGSAACELPNMGACRAVCTPVLRAACLAAGSCATFTPTPSATPTPTLGANDCCQCGSAACQLPSMGGCPAACTPVPHAACLTAGNCATFTPTPTATPTPTLGANDCCQCGSAACQLPSLGGCPAACTPVPHAACLAAGSCATFTPTPSATLTPTLGANDCCQCGSAACQLPSMGGCPAACTPVPHAACLAAGSCATFTPTPTRSATSVPPTIQPKLDDDSCSLAPTEGRSRTRAVLWLAGPVVLVLWRRRSRR